jgi:hypothetical protein
MSLTIFPERERSNHLSSNEADDDGEHRVPLDYIEGTSLPGLMALANFRDGGHELTDAKILVIVRFVGPRKTGQYFSTITLPHIG